MDFLNMLTTVDHLRNGSSSILKRHSNTDILLLSLLLGVVQGYLSTVNKRAAKAYRKIVNENDSTSAEISDETPLELLN